MPPASVRTTGVRTTTRQQTPRAGLRAWLSVRGRSVRGRIGVVGAGLGLKSALSVLSSPVIYSWPRFVEPLIRVPMREELG
jgi:hypothetical protein